MAPKVPEKHQPHNNSISIKHSNPFHISAHTLCHNKRLKLKRSKYGEYLRNVFQNKRSTPQLNSHKTEARRQKLSLLPANVTINLLSDDDEQSSENTIAEKQTVITPPESMCLERAAILGLMPVNRSVKHFPLLPSLTNHRQPSQIPIETRVIKPHTQYEKVQLHKSPLNVPMPKHSQQLHPRKRKSKPQKRRSLPIPSKTPILINDECIVLSDDSNDVPITMAPSPTPRNFIAVVQPTDLSVTYPTSSYIPCLPEQNSIQVDEEVTISLVPRSANATSCAKPSVNGPTCPTNQQEVFPMLPDETTVHTVIANRIYELSLSKLREGLASCGIPEFADGQQKISPQRRKGIVQQPPLVSPPQAPISLKLSSDLSISLISDDEDDERQRNSRDEPILSPAFLQKLPVNVSIAPVPPKCNHATEPKTKKLKLG